MKLASHDTFTYLPIRKWYLKIFKWFARCQSQDYKTQIENGAEMLDIRVRFEKKTDEPYICHGIVEYEGDVYEILDYVNKNHPGMPIRLILEKKHTGWQDFSFALFCAKIQREYPNCKFFGGLRKDWQVLYNFGVPYMDIEEKIGSVSGNLIYMALPVLYAKKYNKEILEKGSEHEFLMIDFIGDKDICK